MISWLWGKNLGLEREGQDREVIGGDIFKMDAGGGKDTGLFIEGRAIEQKIKGTAEEGMEFRKKG